MNTQATTPKKQFTGCELNRQHSKWGKPLGRWTTTYPFTHCLAELVNIWTAFNQLYYIQIYTTLLSLMRIGSTAMMLSLHHV